MKKEYLQRRSCGYWNIGNCIAIDKAQTYNELFDIAIDFIPRMPQPLIQFCGPISTGGKGLIESNLAELDKAILFFAVKGVSIFDQIPFEEPMQRIKSSKQNYNYDLLNQFYVPIFQSGYIKKFVFLPGWESSVGARWEHDWAKKYGIKIEYLPNNWYEDDYDLVI
ncbi:MAG: DUF4406 domain-containing protein [Candidatus Absconditicoccaceae bacterium]